MQDVDEPLNTTPDFTSTHVFSTADITGTFDGLTQGTLEPGDAPVIDFGADPKVTKDGVDLYPINSEFGFNVTDFVGAVQKDYVVDSEYAEGWAGDLTDPGTGDQLGIVVSDSPTDTFKTPALLGTWLAGLGGNSVKASTEHYSVMQAILSDQMYPEDPNAEYQLDDNLKLVGGEYDGQFVADVLPLVGDANGDGAVDIRDVLEPNETEIDNNIAVGNDYSVTLKDDGKLLYRWGNMIKKPNDIRLEANLDTPGEFLEMDPTSGLMKLFKVTQAELVVSHTITNNPNDQIRPEDYENESAIGTLPTYEILPDGKWVTTDDYYAGDGTLYPAGTVLKDPATPSQLSGTVLEQIGTASVDLLEGYTNEWYTTMDREPFEPVLNLDGTEYITGPRWRLKPDKYGQDLPSVEIPLDPSLPPPPTQGQDKYTVGEDTQTVINLLDWEYPVSPLSISAGWQHESGSVTANGVNLGTEFDVAFYVKGDIKPATLYNAELVMSYEEVAINGIGDTIAGGADDDYLVGQGSNTFSGGDGEDLFVVNYGVTDEWTQLTNNTITDFEVGTDTLGLIGLDMTMTTLGDVVEQTVVGSDLQISLGGFDIALLEGVTEHLGLEDVVMLNPQVGSDGKLIGSGIDNYLVGDEFGTATLGLDGNDELLGLDGNDSLYGGADDDTLKGGEGDDLLVGSSGNDSLEGEAGFDTLLGGSGFDTLIGGDDDDTMDGGGQADVLMGGAENDNLSGYIGNDRIYGEAGENTLSGGEGDDMVIGGDDADLMNGDNGEDKLFGNGGDDIINGGFGFDSLVGGDGGDTMDGGGLADVLYGQLGADELLGGGGNDWLFGGADGDTLNGGADNDRLEGAGGSDIFVFADGFGTDVIIDFDATDDAEKIDLSGVTSIVDFADLTNVGTPHMTQVGLDVVIDDFAGNTVTLLNVSLGDLDSLDFIF